jgi:hypothetical protein
MDMCPANKTMGTSMPAKKNKIKNKDSPYFPKDIHPRESHDSRSTKIYRIRNIIFHTLALLDLRI